MAFITIDRKNLFRNLDLLCARAGDKNKIAAVLKDNAYGHGLDIVARLVSEYGIREAVVISYDEALKIEKLFDNILVLDDKPRARKALSFAVTSIDTLEDVDPEARIELKIDTGMRRNGIVMDEMEKAVEIIKRRGLNLTGVMTHYRSADELGSGFYWQKKRFESVVDFFRSQSLSDLRFHSCNSAALLRKNGTLDEDLARTGIAIYGYSELPECFGAAPLYPVMKLWAERVSTRRLKKGERVGYGGEFEAPRDMVVSTYDLGYGHGWPRGDASRPYRLPDGRPLLGRVSMDFISVEGEDETICVMDDAKRAAAQFGTISYEMTTALSADIERRIV